MIAEVVAEFRFIDRRSYDWNLDESRVVHRLT